MSRSYPRLSIEEFGKHLLEDNDLDPIYVALTKMEWDHAKRGKWLLGYWCFYHAGVACHLSDQPGETYFEEMMRAAVNEELTPTGERWPRGHERRHFRGQQGIRAVNELANRYASEPEKIIDFLIDGEVTEPRPFYVVADRVQEHRGFGPWISFKICDMLDRLDIEPVNFTDADVFMFKDPVKAALNLWRLKYQLPENAQPKDQAATIRGVVEYLTDHFKDHMAPPNGDRPVGLQEVETILCKWKSHMNGHYPLFNDINEINEGILPWCSHSETAQEFYQHMPKDTRK